jgi:hypothetical protein
MYRDLFHTCVAPNIALLNVVDVHIPLCYVPQNAEAVRYVVFGTYGLRELESRKDWLKNCSVFDMLVTTFMRWLGWSAEETAKKVAFFDVYFGFDKVSSFYVVQST